MTIKSSCRVRDRTFFSFSFFLGSLSLEEVPISAGVKDPFSLAPPESVHVKWIIHPMRMCVCSSVSFNHECIQR